MRTHRVLLAAAVAAGAGLTPAAAQAETPGGIYYVNSGVQSCSDSGPGTASQPFCTIQKAADIVQPGQTVRIGGGNAAPYGSMRLTRSGTPAAPIRFERLDTSQYSVSFRNGNEVSLAPGLHDVRISGLAVSLAYNEPAQTLRLAGTSSIHFDSGKINAALDLTGASKVTVSRTEITNPVKAGAGASDITLSTNLMTSMWQSTQPIILVDGAQNTTITSNTISRNHAGIAVKGSAANTRITNNYFPPKYPYSPVQVPYDLTKPSIEVESDSTAGTKASYSAFGTVSNPPTLYRWAGTNYPTVTAFQAATGQGTADLTENSPADRDRSQSALPAELIDSADSGAPGQLGTDVLGGKRVQYPGKAGQAPYHDRGAYERRPQLSVSGGQIGYNGSADGMTALWKDVHYDLAWPATRLVVTYTWGDGTSTVRNIDLPAGNGPFSGQLSPETHRYQRPDAYRPTVEVKLADHPEVSGGTSGLFSAPALDLYLRPAIKKDGGQARADFNGDGYDDVALLEETSFAFRFRLLQGGAGGFAPDQVTWTGPSQWHSRIRHLTAGDFNGDGRAELGIFFQQLTGYVAFYTLTFDTAKGTFGEAVLRWEAPNWGVDTRHVSAGDFNGDGRTDLAMFYQYSTTDVGLFTLQGNADGSLGGLRSQLRAPFWGGGTTFMAAGDYTGDGRADLAMFYEYTSSTVAVFTMTANASGELGGLVTPWGSEQWGPGTLFVQAGDFTGDKKADLALFYDYGNGAAASFSLTSGTNPVSTLETLASWPQWGWDTAFLTAGRYTAKDGRSELGLVYNYGSGNVTLWGLTPGNTTPVARWSTHDMSILRSGI
ncbi:FG-GAP-like repeat-containing protein [Longispora albida]|uniref:FG-GAP-like repeat-containing protein n=1 Tax=Longispora albida TaxID=203523 RepID=UPI00037F3693|nr:FG-GAP-like repeat-containing protein [Longispora albida]